MSKEHLQMRILGNHLDLFDTQTDRMTAADAKAELLRQVRAAREGLEREMNGGQIDAEIGIKIGIIGGPGKRQEEGPSAWALLYQLEQMLTANPKDSFWALELRHRRKGNYAVPLAIAEEICRAYEGELACEDKPRPAKVIIGDLAQRYDVPDTTIRGIIRRANSNK